MAKNDFKAFATDRNANVISQEEWEALPALLSGFTAGKASSAQVNKVIRQASFIAAALAQFVSEKTQRDVLDNGDLPGFVELLGSGFAVEYLSRKNPFGDIKSDGTVKTALENLGLGEGSALPVGVPVPWPLAVPPAGWLKCNGAAFTDSQYPRLALAYPSLRLPDLRGEFIRGWDDGRGVDSGRTI
ncbi:phage tail protein, partial [Escherichia coli]|uniref:phage tail protein n=1 Tax=Escherichia coli TaxID=562 RepID=UPI0007A598A6